VTQVALTTHQQVKGAVPVRVDVFPATVRFSWMDNPYAKVRAILTADEALMLVEATGGPAVLYTGRLEDVTGDRQTVTATTADGDITITRAGGCGCGSKLRAYRPFTRTVRMAKIPA